MQEDTYMNVPFLDLKVQRDSIKQELMAAIGQVIDNTAFAGGKYVEQFENEYADYCNCKYAVGVGSGTAALWAALLAMDVGEGDEVITVPNTFIATVEAIYMAGAETVFVDVDEKTYNMDPEKLKDAITSRTKAIIPVHLYGQPADMDPIIEIAKEHGLYVIEDASQAHAAEYKGKKAGTIGDAGCFSFYPGKNLGAYGEAGIVVTDNEEFAENMRMFRDHGQNKKYYHEIIGWNSRMDGLQGAVLSVKLKHLDKWTELRRRNAAYYTEFLQSAAGVTIPYESPDVKHVYHIYPVLVENPGEMQQMLKEKDIFSAMHYPVPIHLQNAFAHLNISSGSFPAAERSSSMELSLPMFPELSEEQIHYVCDQIREILT